LKDQAPQKIEGVLAPPGAARLSIGSSAAAVSTAEHLRFKLDHALARDAVQAELDTANLQRGLLERGLKPVLLHSAATDRKTYLVRPDLGRALAADSAELLRGSDGGGEVLFILADGLSALAIERHALLLLDAVLPLLSGVRAMVPVVTNARVAISDEIGALTGAKIAVVLIGERPGLSSPDSLGAYITWNPRIGCTDAERNCISNIRQEGLSYGDAAHRIAHYLGEARRLQMTGIALKDPETLPKLGPRG
jgi:ethanolamine ammonia-lyase small subunit